MPAETLRFEPIVFEATKYSPVYIPVPMKSLKPIAIAGKEDFSLRNK